jgi:hypothetical protein
MNLKITNVGTGTVLLRQHLAAGGVDEQSLGPTAYAERVDVPGGPNVMAANVEVIPYDEADFTIEVENTDMPADQFLAVSEVNTAGAVLGRSINQNVVRVHGKAGTNAYWAGGFRIETAGEAFGEGAAPSLDAMEYGDLSAMTRAQIQSAQMRIAALGRRLEQAEDDLQNRPAPDPEPVAAAPSWAPQPPLPPQAQQPQQPQSSTAVQPMTTTNAPGLVQGDPTQTVIPLP